tara:strand:+ start:396 stop:1421 length:1026 start_codon:yes stop_codon:yes gene_type:complete
MKEGKNLVIVDAANILRDDRGCIIRDENQNRQVQMRPERLDMVIKHIKSGGGQPVCILRNGTFHSGKKRKDSEDPRFGDWALVEAGIESGEIVQVSDDDDMYCVTLALQTKSILVSRDQFRPEQKKYSQYDWELVAELRIGDYNFIAGQFVSPELDRAMVERFSKNDETNGKVSSRVNVSKAKVEVNKVKKSTPSEEKRKPTQSKKPTKSGSKKAQKNPPNDVNIGTLRGKPELSEIVSMGPKAERTEPAEELMILLDELYASLYSLTADDGQCNQAMVLEMLAKEFLGKSGYSSEWKKGWVSDLKSYINAITHSDQRPIKWVRENLPDAFVYSNPYIIRS